MIKYTNKKASKLVTAQVIPLQGETLRKFEVIVQFVIQSYFKLYFDIKVKNSLVDAPRHILTALRIFRTQPEEVQAIIKDTLIKGAYHAHSENIILSLLASNIEEERDFAIDKILEIRGPFNKGNPSIRNRVTPELNFNATTLTNLILWEKQAYEPIFTCKLTSETIKSFKNTPLDVPYYQFILKAQRGQSKMFVKLV